MSNKRVPPAGVPDRENACGRHYGPQPQAKIILDSILKMRVG